MADKKDGKWIQKANIKKNALRKELGVKGDKKITSKQLTQAAKKAKKTGNTKLARRVALAKTFKKMSKKK